MPEFEFWQQTKDNQLLYEMAVNGNVWELKSIHQQRRLTDEEQAVILHAGIVGQRLIVISFIEAETQLSARAYLLSCIENGLSFDDRFFKVCLQSAFIDNAETVFDLAFNSHVDILNKLLLNDGSLAFQAVQGAVESNNFRLICSIVEQYDNPSKALLSHAYTVAAESCIHTLLNKLFSSQLRDDSICIEAVVAGTIDKNHMRTSGQQVSWLSSCYCDSDLLKNGIFIDDWVDRFRKQGVNISDAVLRQVKHNRNAQTSNRSMVSPNTYEEEAYLTRRFRR